MASTAAIIRNLREEIATEIKTTIVTRPIEAAFAKFVLLNRDKSGKDILSSTGRPRMFYVGRCEFKSPDNIGYTTESSRCEIPITFVYPTKDTWETAAADDLAKFRHYFSVTPSSVSGVNQRFIEYGEPTFAEHPQEPWGYYTVKMIVYIEADHS